VLINEFYPKEELGGRLVIIPTVATIWAIVTIVIIFKIVFMVAIEIINTIA
jgi:hypothetical protein